MPGAGWFTMREARRGRDARIAQRPQPAGWHQARRLRVCTEDPDEEQLSELCRSELRAGQSGGPSLDELVENAMGRNARAELISAIFNGTAAIEARLRI